ncbi:MAG: hypothetical protein AUI05_03395 [Verrucomicrobia bacterium 13_2_20CM_2_54_15_9cls]|nr:MAG: hypothetical protein AUI05_03395 [Verrucomicrobia bacterium 13_2_20CM_2_54_15_9cls]
MNISEKLLPARMTDTKSSPKKQSSARAAQLAAGVTSERAYERFPSYLRTFDIFLQHSHGGSGKEIAPSYTGFSEQFPMVSVTVAFV